MTVPKDALVCFLIVCVKCVQEVEDYFVSNIRLVGVLSQGDIR
jgi:hypothetical protein